MRIIGTSGHVDHGKSTLVERLSGINPDRLAEEQSRQMTIDLGFAWMSLPDGETVGIVDVPGHRDFIENMLAGVGGIDAAILVVAADEGVMPQTREHLSILRLLDVQDIIVALSKVDLIDDPDWLELVRLDIEECLSLHRLDGAPIVEASARTGLGMEDLRAALQKTLSRRPSRPDYGQPRLPVDRVFVVSGFGVVVTGALSGGRLSAGDAVELQPSGVSGRIRGLQSYQRTVETVLPGSRVAVNIAGVSSQQVQRGHVLTLPKQLRPTVLVDAQFNQLGDVSKALRHNAEVKFFSGAAESMAHVRLLDADSLGPNDSGWLQIRLREPMALSRGDRFILRYPSPAETVGGGLIVNARPRGRLKRFRQEVIEDLALRLHGSPAERLAKAAESDGPQTLDGLRGSLGFSGEEFEKALAEALELGLVRRVGKSRYWSAISWQKLSDRAMTELRIFHREHPLRLGMPRAELRSRLKVKQGLLDALVEEDELCVAERQFVRHREHQVLFSEEQRAKIERLMEALSEEPFSPPAIEEMNLRVGEHVVRALLDMRRLVNVSDRIAFSAEAYERMVDEIEKHILAHDEIDAKTLRDKFATSRKYAIAMLEHLDSLGITRRVGDVRMRGRNLQSGRT